MFFSFFHKCPRLDLWNFKFVSLWSNLSTANFWTAPWASCEWLQPKHHRPNYSAILLPQCEGKSVGRPIDHQQPCHLPNTCPHPWKSTPLTCWYDHSRRIRWILPRYVLLHDCHWLPSASASHYLRKTWKGWKNCVPRSTQRLFDRKGLWKTYLFRKSWKNSVSIELCI